jgi:predicted SprT family Zn-dependent metalloprotease
MAHRKTTQKKMSLATAIARFAPDLPQAAHERLREMGVAALPVKWNGRLTRSLGRFMSSTNRLTGVSTPICIDLNPELRRESPAQLTETFLHELAHLIAGHAAGHGPIWKTATVLVGMVGAKATCAPSKLNVIGKTGRTAPKALKTVAVCDRCGFELKRRQRLPRTRRYRHPRCGGELVGR